jgi:hypothetical protein
VLEQTTEEIFRNIEFSDSIHRQNPIVTTEEMFESYTEYITREWSILYRRNDKLHNLYVPPNIFRMVKLGKIRSWQM